MLKKLFGEAGVKNAVTLFHQPTSATSARVLSLLKQANASLSSDSSSSSSSPAPAQSSAGGGGGAKKAFALDVSEQAPTSDQLRSIIEFAGEGQVGSIVEGASDVADAQRRVRLDVAALKRPLTVDWNAGKVVAGDNESAIKQMIESQANA